MISIIVPVYNAEKYRPHCIDSILVQTYTDFELILVDDGSPDNCGKICDEYAAKDSHVRVIHQKNGGVSAARNAGLDEITGEYVTFVDADDWIHPMYLEILLKVLLENDVDVSVCTYERPTEHINTHCPLTDQINVEKLSAENLLLRHEWNFNYIWGKLYRSALFNGIRYPVGKNYEDTYTTYRVLFAARDKEVAWIDRPLYFYYKNVEGITRSPWTPKELEVFDGIHNQLDFYRENGYEQAYKKEHWLYVNHFAYQISRIRENKKDLSKNRPYLRKLRSKMLKVMRQDPETYGYKEMPQCYEAAFPLAMRVYHFFGKVARLVFRK